MQQPGKKQSKQQPKKQPKKQPQATKQILKHQNLMQIQKKHDQPSKQSQKISKHLSPIITPQHYTSLNIKHLGNHSLWKRTTSQTRFNDQRLELLKQDYFMNKFVLDVGCNEGFLGMEIAMKFFPKKIYAIDIDHKLIKNARKTLYSVVRKEKGYREAVKGQENENEKSKGEDSMEKEEMVKESMEKEEMVKESMERVDMGKESIKTEGMVKDSMDIIKEMMEEEEREEMDREVLKGPIQIDDMRKEGKKQSIWNKIQQLPLFFQDRLKETFSQEFFMPQPMQVYQLPISKVESKFPFNIKFEADNIYTIKYQQDILHYDTIMCLKVTKWIHLTFGDDGIRRLFQKIYDLLRADGLLILQAQDWLSYKRKKNMYDVYRNNFDRIRLGPDQFETVLVDDPLKEFRFQLVDKIEHNSGSRKQKLDYPILVFKKTSTMLYY